MEGYTKNLQQNFLQEAEDTRIDEDRMAIAVENSPCPKKGLVVV